MKKTFKFTLFVNDEPIFTQEREYNEEPKTYKRNMFAAHLLDVKQEIIKQFVSVTIEEITT